MAKAATKTNKTTRSPRRTTVSNNNKNTRSKTASTKNSKLEAEVEEKPKKATTTRRASATKTTGRTQTKKAATPKKTETKTATNSRKSSTASSSSTRKTTKTATKATTKPKETSATKASTTKTSTRGKGAGTSTQETKAKTTTRKTPAKKTTSTRKTTATRKTSGTTNRRTNSRTNSRRKKEEEIQKEDIVLEVPTEEVDVVEEEEEVHQDFAEEQPEEEHHDHEVPSEDDIIDVELFDEHTVDKAIDLVNVAFVHHTSKIMDYIEGNRLIVKDTLGNRYKLNLKPSHNPIVDPRVSSFYVMRPANFKEGEKFESELFALFSNEEVATLFLANLVEIHDHNGNKISEDEPFNHADKRNQLINIHSSYLKSNNGIGAVIDWCMKNKRLVLSLSGIVLFLILAFFVLSSVFSSKHDSATGYNKSHKSYVALSPTEEKIRADNTVISEINRIQNNEPPIGSVGLNIRSHGLDAEKLALLKKNMQEDVAKLIELQGKLNSGMGAQTGGRSVPFNSQTDRFGISNVPPEDSWATSTGARMSVPSGSNGVASQKDLAEFGIIN